MDLSFNRIKEIKGLETLTSIRKLYLSANRLRKMENLETLTTLEILDVGDNKIRKIENIDTLVNLTEFHAAKNKLEYRFYFRNISDDKEGKILTAGPNCLIL